MRATRGKKVIRFQYRPASGGSCDPNYESACLEPELARLRTAPAAAATVRTTPAAVRVVGDDPHGLDRDGDGYACES